MSCESNFCDWKIWAFQYLLCYVCHTGTSLQVWVCYCHKNLCCCGGLLPQVILSLRNFHQYIFCREHFYFQIAFIFDPSVELILLLSNTVCLCICYLFSYVLYALVTFIRMFFGCVLFLLSVVHIKCVYEYYESPNQTSPLIILMLLERFWYSSRSAAYMCSISLRLMR